MLNKQLNLSLPNTPPETLGGSPRGVINYDKFATTAGYIGGVKQLTKPTSGCNLSP
jgi:hypothetical protein